MSRVAEEGNLALSGVSVIKRVLIPFIRIELLGPVHLPKAPLSKAIALVIRF